MFTLKTAGLFFQPIFWVALDFVQIGSFLPKIGLIILTQQTGSTISWAKGMRRIAILDIIMLIYSNMYHLSINFTRLWFNNISWQSLTVSKVNNVNYHTLSLSALAKSLPGPHIISDFGLHFWRFACKYWKLWVVFLDLFQVCCCYFLVFIVHPHPGNICSNTHSTPNVTILSHSRHKYKF